mmetsp:Transcript_35242/g.108017  ORF Transcript_35242/g.108017 Transcript_35242/m.108017 type:complete len:300 (-) Transcript_35242:16-915(-)
MSSAQMSPPRLASSGAASSCTRAAARYSAPASTCSDCGTCLVLLLNGPAPPQRPRPSRATRRRRHLCCLWARARLAPNLDLDLPRISPTGSRASQVGHRQDTLRSDTRSISRDLDPPAGGIGSEESPRAFGQRVPAMTARAPRRGRTERVAPVVLFSPEDSDGRGARVCPRAGPRRDWSTVMRVGASPLLGRALEQNGAYSGGDSRPTLHRQASRRLALNHRGPRGLLSAALRDASVSVRATLAMCGRVFSRRAQRCTLRSLGRYRPSHTVALPPECDEKMWEHEIPLFCRVRCTPQSQ